MGGVLGLVPARGGSKGIPDKNLRDLAGRPLLHYVAEAAAASGVVDRLVLSTDSPAIAALGRRLGIDVPFERPAELASDEAPMLPVIQHAVLTLEAAGWPVEVVVLLQPTSPLRTGAQIRAAVTTLRESGADSVVSVQPVPLHLSPDYVLRLEDERLVPFLAEGSRVTRRQDVRPAYYRDGTVYCTRRDVVMNEGSIYGTRCLPLVLEPGSTITIDTPEDWNAAEAALAARGGKS